VAATAIKLKNTVSEGDTNLRADRHCVRTDTQTDTRRWPQDPCGLRRAGND